jgi:hypothetical protein
MVDADGRRDANAVMISADANDSNGYRIRQWKIELQKLADEIKLPTTLCRWPPGKPPSTSHTTYSMATGITGCHFVTQPLAERRID